MFRCVTNIHGFYAPCLFLLYEKFDFQTFVSGIYYEISFGIGGGVLSTLSCTSIISICDRSLDISTISCRWLDLGLNTEKFQWSCVLCNFFNYFKKNVSTISCQDVLLFCSPMENRTPIPRLRILFPNR